MHRERAVIRRGTNLPIVLLSLVWRLKTIASLFLSEELHEPPTLVFIGRLLQQPSVVAKIFGLNKFVHDREVLARSLSTLRQLADIYQQKFVQSGSSLILLNTQAEICAIPDRVKAARRRLTMATRVSDTCRTAYKLDGRPVLADRHEAWCLMETGWRMLEENEAFMEAVAVTDPEAIRQFSLLPPLPNTAFSSYRTVH